MLKRAGLDDPTQGIQKFYAFKLIFRPSEAIKTNFASIIIYKFIERQLFKLFTPNQDN